MYTRFTPQLKHLGVLSGLLICATLTRPCMAVSKADRQGVVTIEVGSDRLSLIGNGHVLQVTESKPVQRWIFQKGDVVLSANGRLTHVPEDLFDVLRSTAPTGSVISKIERGSKQLTVIIPKGNYIGSVPPSPPTPPTVSR